MTNKLLNAARITSKRVTFVDHCGYSSYHRYFSQSIKSQQSNNENIEVNTNELNHPTTTENVSHLSEPHTRGLTSTTAKLWEMRRDHRDKLTSSINKTSTIPTISNESNIYPRHPRFASMDAQLSSALELLSSSASNRSYLLPSDSHLCIELPFKSQPAFHDEYVRFDGGVRFGKILEDMDAFAANIAHMHVLLGSEKNSNLPPNKIMLVTASLESIVLKCRFPMDRDVLMRGNVVYVGRSSIEVWIEMVAINNKNDSTSNNNENNSNTEEKILDAVFAMAARDSTTGLAAPLTPLDTEHMNSEDLARYKQGEGNKERRKRELARSLIKSPPTTDEIAILHSFLMSNGNNQNNSENTRGSGHEIDGAIIHPKVTSMSSTSMSSINMTQPQERNTNGKIFGGSLMRKAYELARTCAYVFAGASSHPYLVASDTITFLKPVEIGSVIEFSSKVIYSSGTPSPLFQIKVETKIRDLIKNTEFMSNTFNFTFRSDSIPLRKIQPHTYTEAMQWLDGRRIIQKHTETHKDTKMIEGNQKI